MAASCSSGAGLRLVPQRPAGVPGPRPRPKPSFGVNGRRLSPRDTFITCRSSSSSSSSSGSSRGSSAVNVDSAILEAHAARMETAPACMMAGAESTADTKSEQSVAGLPFAAKPAWTADEDVSCGPLACSKERGCGLLSEESDLDRRLRLLAADRKALSNVPSVDFEERRAILRRQPASARSQTWSNLPWMNLQSAHLTGDFKTDAEEPSNQSAFSQIGIGATSHGAESRADEKSAQSRDVGVPFAAKPAWSAGKDLPCRLDSLAEEADLDRRLRLLAAGSKTLSSLPTVDFEERKAVRRRQPASARQGQAQTWSDLPWMSLQSAHQTDDFKIDAEEPSTQSAVSQIGTGTPSHGAEPRADEKSAQSVDGGVPFAAMPAWSTGEDLPCRLDSLSEEADLDRRLRLLAAGSKTLSSLPPVDFEERKAVQRRRPTAARQGQAQTWSDLPCMSLQSAHQTDDFKADAEERSGESSFAQLSTGGPAHGAAVGEITGHSSRGDDLKADISNFLKFLSRHDDGLNDSV